MKFLVTNDDGIDAAGLAALVSAARTVGEPVVVAPAGPQSGVSRAVLPGTKASGSSRVTRVDSRSTALRPTAPASVYFISVPETRSILSGINHGANLGADVFTRAPSQQCGKALLHGWPGIAFSHYRKSGIEFDWSRATRWITPVLAGLVAKPIEPGVFYNVNLPLLPPDAPDRKSSGVHSIPSPFRSTTGRAEKRSVAGDYSLRLRTPGADVDVCFGGRIAVTAVRLL